jgi:hypothetical protein
MTSLADPTPAVAAGTVKIDPEGMARLGHDLHSQFRRYESDRRLAELKWERNARQFLGIYDPEIEKTIDKNRSQAYPKLTRVKCVSMLSRLMNLLFQAGDKNWTVASSPVPDLEQADLQQVLDKVMADQQKEEGAEGGMTGAPAVPSDEVIESAIREFAKKRAMRMELEIEDQLQELGGTHLLDYVALCRKVLASGIQYGAGVLKGPFTREEQLRKWEVSAQGQLLAVPYTAYRPCFEFVSLWDYYPEALGPDGRPVRARGDEPPPSHRVEKAQRLLRRADRRVPAQPPDRQLQAPRVRDRTARDGRAAEHVGDRRNEQVRGVGVDRPCGGLAAGRVRRGGA